MLLNFLQNGSLCTFIGKWPPLAFIYLMRDGGHIF